MLVSGLTPSVAFQTCAEPTSSNLQFQAVVAAHALADRVPHTKSLLPTFDVRLLSATILLKPSALRPEPLDAFHPA